MGPHPAPEEEEFGRTLMPDIIDNIARSDPNRLFAQVAKGAGIDDGYRAVTVSRLATAINKAAWWMEEELGKSQPGVFPTVAYIGPQDLRYLVLILGAVKAGYKIFVPSPRNSTHAHLSLLEAYECATLILPTGSVFGATDGLDWIAWLVPLRCPRPGPDCGRSSLLEPDCRF